MFPALFLDFCFFSAFTRFLNFPYFKAFYAISNCHFFSFSLFFLFSFFPFFLFSFFLFFSILLLFNFLFVSFSKNKFFLALTVFFKYLLQKMGRFKKVIKTLYFRTLMTVGQAARCLSLALGSLIIFTWLSELVKKSTTLKSVNIAIPFQRVSESLY